MNAARYCLLSSLSLLLLAGCATPAPTRYYTLVAPTAYVVAESAVAPSYALDIQPVIVPAQVDQPAMVIRQGSGQLTVVDEHQWIAPLGNEIRDALSADLSARLGVSDLHGTTAPRDVTVWRVNVEIQRFDSILGQHAAIDARWSLRRAADERPVVVCTAHLEQAVPAGWPALVAGHQQAIAGLADAISGALQAAQRTGAAICAS